MKLRKKWGLFLLIALLVANCATLAFAGNDEEMKEKLIDQFIAKTREVF